METSIATTTSQTPDDNKVPVSLSETDFTSFKCNHTWKINKFSYCWMKPGEKLDSPTFSSETDSKIKWCLSLYPTGKNDDDKDNLSLYLTLVESYKTEIRVKYKFTILNNKGEGLNLYENTEGATLLQKWDEHKPTCGADKFVSRRFLMDTSEGLLPDDKLTICCEVSAATIIPSASTPNSNNILQADGWGCTQVKVVDFSYLWTIINFSFCKQQTGEFVTSPVFSAKNDNTIQWQLKLYPNGNNETNKENISIFVCPAKSFLTNMQASFKFKIVSEKSVKVTDLYGSSCIWTKGDISCRGYPGFMKRAFLLDKANQLLTDDKLIIHCAIRYVTDTINIPFEAKPIDELLQTPKRRRLNDDLETLLKNEKLSDVTLVVDGRELQVHKAILAARSVVFSAMFEYKPTEQCKKKIEITDMDYEVVQEILWFIYTGTVRKLADMASALLAAADVYVLEELKFMCEQELCSKIGIENAAEMLILAEKYSGRQLKTHAMDFINTHATIVMDTQGFKKMSAFYPQLIAEIAVKRFIALKEN